MKAVHWARGSRRSERDRIAIVTALALGLAAAACDRANSLRASPNEIVLSSAGATMDIETEARNRRGVAAKGAVVTFRARDPHVATVSSSGRVTAVDHGTTTIEVLVDGTDLMEFVHVVVRLPEKIELRPMATTCHIGGLKRLEAKVLDRSGKVIHNVPIEWSISDETKVSLDDGELTGLDEGEVTVTAKALGLEATSRVTVAWAPGMKAMIEAEKRASRGGGGGRRGGGGGGGGSGGGSGWDPRLSIFNDD